MKYKLLLGALSLCLLCNDAAFGSRKKPAVPTPKAKSTTAHMQPLTGLQQYGLFEPLPNTDPYPTSKAILDILSKSTDPNAGSAIGILGELLGCIAAQRQTEALNTTLSGRNVELGQIAEQLKVQLEEQRKKHSEFVNAVKEKSEEAKAKNDQLKKDNERLQTQLGIAKKEKKASETKAREDLESQQKKSTERITQLQARLAKLQKTIDEGAQSQIDQLTKDIAELQAIVNGLPMGPRENSEELREEIEGLKMSRADLQKNSAGYKEEIEELQRRQNELENQLLELRAKYAKRLSEQGEIGKRAVEEYLKETRELTRKAHGVTLINEEDSPLIVLSPQALNDLLSEASEEAHTQVGSINLRPGFLSNDGEILDVKAKVMKQCPGNPPAPITQEELDYIEFFFDNCQNPSKYREIEKRLQALKGDHRFAIGETTEGLFLYALLYLGGDKYEMRRITHKGPNLTFEIGQTLPAPQTLLMPPSPSAPSPDSSSSVSARRVERPSSEQVLSEEEVIRKFNQASSKKDKDALMQYMTAHPELGLKVISVGGSVQLARKFSEHPSQH